jgi:hypothetical protein
MLLAAQRAGWAIAYFRQQDLVVRDGVASVTAAETARDDPEMVRARRSLGGGLSTSMRC